LTKKFYVNLVMNFFFLSYYRGSLLQLL